MASCQAIRELYARANIREIALDTLILISKSPTSEGECLPAVDDDIDNSKRYEVDSPSIIDLSDHFDTLPFVEKDRVDLECFESIHSQNGIQGSHNQCEKCFTTTLTEAMEKMTSE